LLPKFGEQMLALEIEASKLRIDRAKLNLDMAKDRINRFEAKSKGK